MLKTISNQLTLSHTPSPSLSHIYHYSIPTLSHSTYPHPLSHRVHIPTIKSPSSSKTPFPHAHVISISYTLTMNIHITSILTHILAPFLTVRNCIFPTYTLFNNPTQTLMISMLQMIMLSFSTVRHAHCTYLPPQIGNTSHCPPNHIQAYKCPNPITSTMYLSSTITLHFPHSIHCLHPLIIA